MKYASFKLSHVCGGFGGCGEMSVSVLLIVVGFCVAATHTFVRVAVYPSKKRDPKTTKKVLLEITQTKH